MINQAARKKSWLRRPAWMDRLPGTVRPTRLGFGTVMMSAMIAGAAFNTGTNLLYLMFSTLLGMWALNAIMCWINARALRPGRIIGGEAHAGEPCIIRHELHNRKKWAAAYGITLEEKIDGAKPARLRSYFLSLAPGQRATRPVEVTFSRRGWVRFATLRIQTKFPFGLVEYHRTTRIEADLLVLPALVPVAPLLKRHNADLDSRPSRMRGLGSDLYAIRDYQPGDPARAIHWKHSSKGTGIKVREFEREESRRVRIVLDPVLPDKPTDENLENLEDAISTAASLCKRFIEMGYETALWTPETSLPGGTERDHLRNMMRLLAQIDTQAFMKRPERREPPLGIMYLDVHVHTAEEAHSSDQAYPNVIHLQAEKREEAAA